MDILDISNLGLTGFQERRKLLQAEMQLDMSNNVGGTKQDIIELNQNKKEIYKNETSEEFQKSMDVTISCLEDKDKIKETLSNLKKNESDSFLNIYPKSIDHRFTINIRKIDEGFSCTIINTGDRPYPVPCVEYITNASNLDELADILKTPDATLTTSDYYDKFEEIMDDFHELSLVAKDQEIDNCITNGPANGFEFAFFTRNKSRSVLEQFRVEGKSTNFKDDSSTFEANKAYINKMVKDNPTMEKSLKSLWEIYSHNINFINMLDKVDQRPIISLKKAFAPDTKYSGTENVEESKLLLSKINCATIRQSGEKIDTLVSNLGDTEYCEAFKKVKEYCFNKSIYEEQLGDNDTILKDLGKISKYFPWVGRQLYSEYTKHLIQESVQYMDNGENREALKSLNIGIRLNPFFLKLYYERGMLQSSMDNTDTAVKNFEKILEMDPKFAYAYHGLACANLEEEHFQRSISYATKAIQFNDTDPNFYGVRGEANLNLKKYDEAITDFKNSLKLCPENPEVKVLLQSAQKSKVQEILNKVKEPKKTKSSQMEM